MRVVIGCGAVLALTAVACGSTDGIRSVSGDFEIVSPPASVQRQAFESSTAMRVFEERELSAATIPVNAVEPGIYHAYADFDDVDIAPAGAIRSYLIHFDPSGTNLVQLSGSVTFDAPILGIIARSLTMQQTDSWLGAPGRCTRPTGMTGNWSTRPGGTMTTSSGSRMGTRFSFRRNAILRSIRFESLLQFPSRRLAARWGFSLRPL